ncbi:MAG TPA: SDR family oxidoreductase [Nitrospiraceae bacterium]|nr:SDR family oxidoreductase [Nitrospiraceae bacterium]
MKQTVLITGAAGLIGSYLVRTGPRWAPGWHVQGVTRQHANLTDHDQVGMLWRRLQPQAVIHCAALSRAGQCENNPDLAFEINVEATRRLAELARDIPFLFLSSDQVFDGASGGYVETDEVHPLNVYGQSKAKAEQLVLHNPAHTVIRVALTAGRSETGNRSFVEDMRNACREGTTLTLFADEYRCPLPAGVLARAVWELLDRGRPGLYHLSGGERLSRWDIGQALVRWYPELSHCLQAGSVKDYVGPTRPADLSMSSDKIQRLLSFRLPGFREWLASRLHAVADPWDYAEPE